MRGCQYTKKDKMNRIKKCLKNFKKVVDNA